jgi:hypothetical protein
MPSSKFAFYYPEGPGYLHIGVINNGAQGTASLCCSVRDGQILVRKKTAPMALAMNPWRETDYKISHELVAQLLHEQQYLHSGNRGSHATYWAYANALDLHDFIRRVCRIAARKWNGVAPVSLAWRLLSQQLRALEAVHSAGITHNDVHNGNVFVHWRASQGMPSFVLGDLGLVTVFDMEVSEFEGDTPIEDTHHDFQPLSLDQLRSSQVYERSGDIPQCLHAIAKDLFGVRKNCMTLWVQSEGCQELQSSMDTLAKLIEFIDSDQVWLVERYLEILSLLCQHVEKNANEYYRLNLARDSAKLERLRPRPTKFKPQMFDSLDDVRNAPFLPPGPFYVVRINPKTLRLRQILKQWGAFREDLGFTTNWVGHRIDQKGERVNKIARDERLRRSCIPTTTTDVDEDRESGR